MCKRYLSVWHADGVACGVQWQVLPYTGLAKYAETEYWMPSVSSSNPTLLSIMFAIGHDVA